MFDEDMCFILINQTFIKKKNNIWGVYTNPIYLYV